MRIKLFISVLLTFFSLESWTQSDTEKRIIEAKDIPISTSQVQQENLQLERTSNTIDVTNDFQTFKLQDDPQLATVDSLWTTLIKQSDLYDTTSYNINEISNIDIVIKDLSTEVLKERLAIIDAKTPFHVTYNPDLERLIKTYLKTRQKALSNLMAKAKYYFPLFEEKLDKYDIPLEVKYLAIVESALQPKARSRVGATGLWQFMYQTGKQYDLTVSSYVDERQDPFLATEAACKFLADLYNIFGDWDLALAAYNSGPGNVNKAIRRSGGNKNYWNLRSYLPRETASYVPIFYATLYLFEYADEHNLKASADFNLHHFEVDTIQVKRLVTFEQIQTTTGIDEDLLSFLNPAYKLNIIPHIANKNYKLVLPKEYIGLFVNNEAAIYAFAEAEEAKREKPLPEYAELNQRIRYRVRSGDYLGRIAERYGVSVSKIKRWNNLRSTKLRIGQRLTIYPRRLPGITKSKTSVTKKPSSKKTKKPLPKGKYVTYTVKQGDSLWSISQKYQNVSVTQIREWNNIWSSKIEIGTKLKIFKG
ncbi:MAG: LysM peptidoglycan-binding domain-containing protein [Bacteroidota bacterium]